MKVFGMFVEKKHAFQNIFGAKPGLLSRVDLKTHSFVCS